MVDSPQRNEQRSEQRAPQRAEQRPSQQRVLRTGENRFTHDTSLQPPDMAYEWKRVSIWNRPDEEHQINMRNNGWTPVPASRHPELAGLAPTKDGVIIRRGQMLMERAKELTVQSRLADKNRALEQVQTQLQRVGHESRQRGFDKTKVRHGEFSEIPQG